MFNQKREKAGMETATFAGGCFWCMIQPFEKLEGVHEVIAGYTGGHTENPTYEEVCSGTTGHYEAVRIAYDPSSASYEKLLEVFWKQIDPTDPGGQFFDRGRQYKTAIFYHNETQKSLAEKSRAALETSGTFKNPVMTDILKAAEFFPAENYHQDYHKKNPEHYKRYRQGSGRDAFLEKVWGGKDGGAKEYVKPPEDEIRRKLTPIQYKVTRENATERPFENAYWGNKQQGIYVDIVSGEPLFSSLDKFDSGCGWPSFTKPLEDTNVVEREDRSHFMLRTEVRSRHGDSHLGHVFGDGPGPTGMRYCINSAAIRFIPVEDMSKEGYGEYLKLFN